jgi:hypothetical protein
MLLFMEKCEIKRKEESKTIKKKLRTGQYMKPDKIFIYIWGSHTECDLWGEMNKWPEQWNFERSNQKFEAFCFTNILFNY